MPPDGRISDFGFRISDCGLRIDKGRRGAINRALEVCTFSGLKGRRIIAQGKGVYAAALGREYKYVAALKGQGI